MVEIKTISKHSKTTKGEAAPAGSIINKNNDTIEVGGTYARTTTAGHAQYVIIYGKGSNRKSETRHCSEAAINEYKKQLEKAGY